MLKAQQGVTLVEVLGALAIGALMAIGLASLIDDSLEDTKGQQAAVIQAQVVAAATKFVAAGYDTLLTQATATTPAVVTVQDLKNAGFLSSNFSASNGYGQTPCVLVLEPVAGKLDALVVTEGGTKIPAKVLPFVAANAGQGGGFIPDQAPLIAQGAFNSFQLGAADLAVYLTQNCSGTTATGGSLASALFFDGPGNLSSDFVYRNSVVGHPELNQMTTPLQISQPTPPTVESSDLLCNPGPPVVGQGRITTDPTGAVLNCQNGIWQRAGNGFWKDPVDHENQLPLIGNTVGDVRLIKNKSRAFAWTGTDWKALAVDANGTFTTGDIVIENVVTKGAACSPDGRVARDASGLILSCQNGTFQTQSVTELAASETSCAVILPSAFFSPDPDCTNPFTGTLVYKAETDTTTATILRPVTPGKDGLISANAFMRMNRGDVSNPNGANGQAQLVISIINNDTGAVVGTSVAQSTALHNDSVSINATLAKAVAFTPGGYMVRIDTNWSLFNGTSIYNRSNFQLFNGTIVEQTPIITGWTVDLFH